MFIFMQLLKGPSNKRNMHVGAERTSNVHIYAAP